MLHKALLTSFKESPDSNNLYNILVKQDSGTLFSIMHDGIQKFGMELNGVIIRTLSIDMSVVNVPWMLKDIYRGSMNADKLVFHLISVIGSVRHL